MAQDPIAIATQDVEAFNDGDWDRLRASLTDDSVYEEHATGRKVTSADEIVEANQGWKAAFPDAKGTITSSCASGDTVVLEITWEGTQSGPLATPDGGEIPPSNKRVEVKAAQVMRLEGDKVAENHHYFDMLGMLEQIGAVGELAQAN